MPWYNKHTSEVNVVRPFRIPDGDTVIVDPNITDQLLEERGWYYVADVEQPEYEIFPEITYSTSTTATNSINQI